MAAVTPVKNSNKLQVIHYDGLEQKSTENFNFALTVDDCQSTVTAQQIYNWAQGFCNLSTDTYSDVKIFSTRNVDSIAGGGE